MSNVHNIFLTGAGSGIGAHLYAGLREAGHRVFGVGLNGPDLRVNLLQNEDLRPSTGTMAQALNKAWEKMGSVDAVLCNAGLYTPQKLAEAGGDHWLHNRKIIALNLEVPLELTRVWWDRCLAFHDEDAPPPGGLYRMLYTGSMASALPMRHSAAYNASKAGLIAAMRGYAREITPPADAAGPRPFLGVINPGWVAGTEMDKGAYQGLMDLTGMDADEAREYMISKTPLRRPVTTDEVTRAFLAALELPEACSGLCLDMPSASGQRS